MSDIASKRAAFKKLHDSFFVIPNAANAGEAKHLAELGFKAVASTSHGLALTLGKGDLTATLDDTLANLRALVTATDLPVNADFEAGFADDATGVAANAAQAAEAGVAGLSIEDRKGNELYDLPIAIERIKAARAALDAIDPNIVLVGRTEGFLLGNTDVSASIERLKAYAKAGADVLYAPGASKPEDIKAIVDAVAPKPVNVILVSPDMKTADLEKLGVRRVSVGGFLETAAWAGFDAAAKSLAEAGSLPAVSFG
ncbi:2-methylisocitrate lyase-like PEP mutase family enzyme [Pseudochelatococcus lubricantis]|uniref:2-methylisocitrate lyase-like PEP mutase family enzyme n=1 Tax=Pseudochelatococcus lubricantis TaxID=1538102 RepID=A0ABX0V4K8_9HYPH|nr:isocitrate lyase/phosphoenolpyruvate mutase family protein [Pseudochelatococcus lubricantis]NIJ60152.1 2-methylisocitrate lyase-like PEP mutase family enzyme [Pseudochelatococcus lubricantis]